MGRGQPTAQVLTGFNLLAADLAGMRLPLRPLQVAVKQFNRLRAEGPIAGFDYDGHAWLRVGNLSNVPIEKKR